MTAPEYREALATLRLTQAALSRLLEVDKVTPNRWAMGTVAVPRTVELLITAWLAHPDLIAKA